MVTAKCKHSGLEFEAKTKRSKQHPQIAALKNDAHRDGNYCEVLAALDKAADAGGYETVEEYLQIVEGILTGKAEQKKKNQEEAREWHRDQAVKHEEAKVQHDAQKQLLKKSGYQWEKNYADRDEWEEGEPSVWSLYSPDRRQVTTAQALDEIERGANLVEAELAVVVEAGGDLPYDVVIDGKLTEAQDRRQRREKAAKEAVEEEQQAAWEAAKNQVKSMMAVVERFEYEAFETVFSQKSGQYVHKKILRGKVNGVDCAVIYTYFGGHDFYIGEQFYAVTPAAAGLIVIERDEEQDRFHSFFGE